MIGIIPLQTFSSLSKDEQQQVLEQTCKDLVQELDNNNTESVAGVGKFLFSIVSDFHPQVLVAVKTCLGVNQIITHNLDEHPDWEPLINWFSEHHEQKS